MATQLTTFSTAGAFTYTIPSWAHKLDVVALGGGGGGNAGGAGFNGGGGGGAGTYSSKTLVRGVDLGFDKTTLSGWVGRGGTGGPAIAGNGFGGDALASALAVESGGGGTGVAVASGTGTISGSWTHTPFSYDNYVVVAVSVIGAGISFASATRSVTYGGVAMTSFGGVNAGSLGATNNGWVEMFGLAVTPGAGAKTVVATVTSGSVAFTNLKASSSSYGNVTSAFQVTGITGSNTAPSSTNLQVQIGGMLVGAIFARNSTRTAFTAGVTGRYSDNTAAPSFSMTESSILAADYPSLTGGTLAATSPWSVMTLALNNTAAAYGAGGQGGARQGVTQQGQSPGNLTLNGQTYTGGAAAGVNGNSTAIPGNPPGGGGAGTNGVFLGSGPAAGAGGTGRVWIFAYGEFADVSRAITTTLTANSVRGHRVTSTTLATTATQTAIGLRQARVAPSLVVTATRTADSLVRLNILASRAITATTSSAALRNIPTALTPLAVSATRTSAGLRNALVAGSVSITVGLSSVFTENNFAQATTLTTAASTAAGLRNTLASSSTATTASISSATLRNIPSSTTQSETATTTSAGLRNAIVSSSVAVVAARPCLILGQFRPQSSLSASATITTAGRISGLLNSPLTVSTSRTSVVRWAAFFSASLAVNFSSSPSFLRNMPTQVSLPITATRNTVANFSTQLSSSTPVTDTTSSAAKILAVASAPRTISCALTADSLRLARVDVAQTITATRNSIVRWNAYFAASRSITSNSSPVLKNSTTIDATTLPGFPYYLPMRFGVAITASFTGFITRLQFADVARIITAARPLNANAAFRLSSSLSVTPGLTTVLNSNQPTPTNTLAITGTQSSSALRRVFASTSLASTATTSSASRFGGFASTTTPTVASFPTSATAILLLTKLHIITANRTTDALRNARTNAVLAVTADRPSNVKWDSKTNSATAAITATGSAYAVCSTTIDATTLPGFPYYLPMRFGVTFRAGISATAANRFTAPTIPTAVIAAVSAAPRAGWSATPSLAVTLNRSQNANLDADIAASATGSAASSPNTRKNIFISAINATITDTTSGTLAAGFFGSASLASTSTATAVNRLATVISTQTNVVSASSPSSLRNARVASSLVVS